MAVIPAELLDLLERPLYWHLATIRPDDTAQVNPMWYAWDGEFVKFTTTSSRQKHRNLRHNPSVALSVTDPDQPSHYLEVRGIAERIEPDPTGGFFVELATRYGVESPQPPADKERRVVIYMKPTGYSAQ
jgi:PPOX class probable F420-dependent enzyme